jgi:hypothetical protein
MEDNPTTRPAGPAHLKRGRFVLVHQAVVIASTMLSMPAPGVMTAVALFAPLAMLRGATRRDVHTVWMSVGLGIVMIALVFGVGVAMLAYGLGHDHNWR